MAKYKVKYKNSNSTVSIEADSAKSAYIKFLEQSDLNEKPVLVTFESALGSGPQTQSFSDHLNEIVAVNDAQSDQTQQEILSQLKQMNWAIRIGFLYIILVISGIIKPGIFG